MCTPQIGRVPHHSPRRGLTLMETVLAMLIVALGAVAGMRLIGTCTQQNQASLRITNAIILADNIQEMIARLPFWDPDLGPYHFGPSTAEVAAGPLSFNDITDFRDEVSFNPPINSAGVPEPSLSRYTVYLQAAPVNDNNLSQTLNIPAVPPDPDKGYNFQSVRIRVRVEYLRSDGIREEVHRVEWIRSND